jgi:SAM-dependent methyltransferase
VDDDTLCFYRRNAEAYAGWVKAPSTRLKGFLTLLPPGGSILELGCGAGNHCAEMLAAGFSVRATDGSPEMAEIASRRLGRAVDTMRFDELDAHDAYDGVWASACLFARAARRADRHSRPHPARAEARGRLLRELQTRHERRPR